MDLAGTLRRLRHDRDVTQEKLATALGVSFQTVSKWERGESYPDITLLPSLAAFFGTTTDLLLGTDEEQRRRRGFDVAKRLDTLRKAGNRQDTIAYLREYLRENPEDSNNLKILAYEIIEYANTLTDKVQAAGLYREALEMYERILAFDIPDGLRWDIKHYVIESLWRLGENERADKLAEEFHYPLTAMDLGAVKMKYLRGLERVAHATGRVLEAFDMYCEAIDCMVDFDDEFGCGFSDAEKLERLKLAYGMVPLVFDDGRCQRRSENVAQLCAKIAELYVKTADTENAIDYLERAASYALEYDGLQRLDWNKDAEKASAWYPGEIVVSQFSSTLTNGMRWGEGMLRLYKEPTASGELLHCRLTRSAFDVLRSDPSFVVIEKRLRASEK